MYDVLLFKQLKVRRGLNFFPFKWTSEAKRCGTLHKQDLLLLHCCFPPIISLAICLQIVKTTVFPFGLLILKNWDSEISSFLSGFTMEMERSKGDRVEKATTTKKPVVGNTA